MPVTGPTLTAAIVSQLVPNSMKGRDATKLASAVGTAVGNYVITPNLMSATLSGVAGPVGTVQSVAVAGFEPNSMSSLMYTKALTPGIKLTGRDIGKLFIAVSTGLVQVLSTMIVTGTAAGIATGAGVGFFTKLSEPALTNLINAQMKLKGFTGRDTGKLAQCISYGLVTQMSTIVKVTLTSAGAVAPVPPVGPVAVAGIPTVFNKVS